jgi:hypothetical protein
MGEERKRNEGICFALKIFRNSEISINQACIDAKREILTNKSLSNTIEKIHIFE